MVLKKRISEQRSYEKAKKLGEKAGNEEADKVRKQIIDQTVKAANTEADKEAKRILADSQKLITQKVK